MPKTEDKEVIEGEAVVLPSVRPKFAREDLGQGHHGLKTFDDWYGPNFDYDSPEVDKDLKRQAVSIMSQAMSGRKISPMAYNAAQTVVTRGVYAEKKGSEGPSVHFHLSARQIEEAKRQAGLPPPSEVDEKVSLADSSARTK